MDGMAGLAVALLLTVSGNIVTATDRGTFVTLEDCAAFAKRELPGALKLGAAGIGCVQRASDRSLRITMFGPVPKVMGGKR